MYSLSGFMLKPDSICIGERHVSVTEDKTDDFFGNIPYSSLSSAEYTDTGSSATVYEGRTRYRHIVLKDKDGGIVADMPVLAAADADSYLDEISVRISRADAKAENTNSI